MTTTVQGQNQQEAKLELPTYFDMKPDSREALGDSTKTYISEQEPQLRYGELENEQSNNDKGFFEEAMTILPPGKVEIKRNLKALEKRENVISKVSNKSKKSLAIAFEQHQEIVYDKRIESPVEEAKHENEYSTKISDHNKADKDDGNRNQNQQLTESEDGGKEQQNTEEYSDDILLAKLNNTIGNNADLSSKKLQYLDQDIADRRGTFKYTDDPVHYKKARKRLQNRESAVRSRQRKSHEIDFLRVEVQQLKTEKAKWQTSIDALKQSNQQWKDLFTQMQIMNTMNNQQLMQNQQNVLSMFSRKA